MKHFDQKQTGMERFFLIIYAFILVKGQEFKVVGNLGAGAEEEAIQLAPSGLLSLFSYRTYDNQHKNKNIHNDLDPYLSIINYKKCPTAGYH